MKQIKTFPPKLPLGEKQIEFLAKATADKTNEVIDWLNQLNSNYRKSNCCILIGFALIFLGFLLDVLQHF